MSTHDLPPDVQAALSDLYEEFEDLHRRFGHATHVLCWAGKNRWRLVADPLGAGGKDASAAAGRPREVRKYSTLLK